jgi:hypothetical protein
MNVFLNATVIHARQIIVDDMHNVANVKTTTGDSSSNENWAFSSAESTPVRKSVFTGNGRRTATNNASSRSRWVRSE